ncbi:MAG: methyltransferase domain-containing protein [Planctomycetota bacterium]|jgi:ubiquinone/menaquinone biosynthesis C-methylase UbiE
MDAQAEVLQSDRRYDSVKRYYGEVLQKSSDLKTDACCTSEALGPHIQEALALINDEIKSKYYGCGSPIPLCLDGLRILDLGCGSGRDCYVMSKLAGPRGFVYGIDMTENQMAVAKKYVDEETSAFGYSEPNVRFIFDYMENLGKHCDRESLDLVTSNCAINLTEDKETVLQQVYEVLKFGGEMYFSDVYADRRVPEDISKDPVLRGECLGGALYRGDFERIARTAGFVDPRIFSMRIININNPRIQGLVENTTFYSITYRLWKLEGLEDACEDYGHVAVYNGRIPESPFKFELDRGHVFFKNKPERVCGNTALMLSRTRFKEYFNVAGSFQEHFGAFEHCRTVAHNDRVASENRGCCS